ncbi:MAG: hypothetical protein HC859_10310 [Bacteroidia bacterium]|nr:hypothetical protein [Bacteroidia bacterium]
MLGPEETVRLPVTLFASEKNIKQAKVDVKVSGPVSLAQSSKTVTFAGIGDLTTDFELSVKPQTGVAKVEVTATSGNYKATDIIEIEIRNPNTPVTKVIDQLLEPGKTWDADLAPFGILGTNTAVLEVSNIPPINLGSRIRYLFNYPYGCVEQTTSSVFPQLYLDFVKVLTDNEKAAVQRNVTAGIERLKQFVHGDGGFSYWPGNTSSDPWGTTYAGHFLIEAKAKGYYVPADMIKGWQKFQRARAQEWRREDEYYNTTLMQAYRLYALALSGSPELGAMNRLREMSLSSTAAWMLAAAYAKSGQAEAAKKLIANLDLTVKPYREMGYTYGSDVRDKALIIETLVLLNEKTKAFELVKELSERLSSYYWMSTQEVAFSLKAIAAFVGLDKKGELKFKYTINGKTVTASSELPISQVTVTNADAKQTIKVVSESKGTLFARVIMEGTPARGQEDDAENNLRVTVNYTDTNGVPIDPARLEQGTEFVAQVTVSHPGVRSGYQNMALAQVFASGWEINNLRLTDDTQGFLTMDAFTYQDIRDDRVYTYFDLWRNTTKTYKVLLTASYAGKFYLPAVSCEAMYDNSIYGRKKGMEVEVVKPVVQ